MKITCCRCGSLNSPNRKAKGQFIREFNSLEELAKFIAKENYKLYFPKIKAELTSRQREVLCKKTASLKHKRRDKNEMA